MMEDFHVLLYLIHIGSTKPLDLWLGRNLQRIHGLSDECKYNAHGMYII